MVEEVAPNVVDVSAVALSSGSPLFVTNVEYELDTHSRSRAGVPILGRVLVELRDDDWC